MIIPVARDMRFQKSLQELLPTVENFRFVNNCPIILLSPDSPSLTKEDLE